MSLLVAVAGAAGAVLLARVIGETLRSRRRGAPEPVEIDEGSADDPFVDLPCRVGDVVVRKAEGDEAWLAAALVFAEGRPIAALFIAPEAGHDRAVFARKGDADLTWLRRAVSAGSSGREPPTTIEHEGLRYGRTRRLPVRVRRVGAGAPAAPDHGVLAEYVGPGAARFVLLQAEGAALAFAGTALGEGEYDLLPGGDEPTE